MISMEKYMQYTWSLSGNLQFECDHFIKDEGAYILKLNWFFFLKVKLVENIAICSKRNMALWCHSFIWI